MVEIENVLLMVDITYLVLVVGSIGRGGGRDGSWWGGRPADVGHYTTSLDQYRSWVRRSVVGCHGTITPDPFLSPRVLPYISKLYPPPPGKAATCRQTVLNRPSAPPLGSTANSNHIFRDH